MAEIRNLTRNGETFYPLTHEKAVIGMEDFKDTITTQISQYQPIEITGDVTNAPDEEDITSDSNNLLKFKNRNNLYGLGKIILRRGSSFASQVTQANTIYVIQYNFDLEGARVNIPNGAILLFEGGSLSNGTLVCADLYDVRLVYYQDISVILNSVTLEGNFIYKACDKDTIGGISVDNSSIEENELGQLTVKAGGIQNTHLNSSIVDNSGISLDSNNKISIKDGGVTGAKLNSEVVNTDDLSIVSNKIQLANRGTTDGMGKIILRKDQSFASQLTQTNTIYVIHYNFTLTSNVTIPANCVLEFDGGSISGAYTLTGSNTKIQANKKIFDSNIIFAGTWNCSQIESYWWDIRENDSTYDNSLSLQKGIDLAALTPNGKFSIEGNGILYVDTTITDHSDPYWYTKNGAINMKSNVHVVISNNLTIKIMNTSEENHSCFNFFFVEDASIKGGNIKGDLDVNYQGKSGEWGYGISLWSCKNILIEDCNISYFLGDSIVVSRCDDKVTYPFDTDTYQYNCKNVIIRNCDFSYNGRQGISITGLISGIIENCYIHDIAYGGYGTNPKMGIDIEPNKVLVDELVQDVLIQNNKFSHNAAGAIDVVDITTNRSGNKAIDNIVIQDCVDDTTYVSGSSLRIINGHNTVIKNCIFTGMSFTRIKNATDYVKVVGCKGTYISFEKQTDEYPAHHIEFTGCQLYNPSTAVYQIVFRKSHHIIFNNCSFHQNVSRRCQDFNGEDSDIYFNNCAFINPLGEILQNTGVTYNNCSSVTLPVIS